MSQGDFNAAEDAVEKLYQMQRNIVEQIHQIDNLELLNIIGQVVNSYYDVSLKIEALAEKHYHQKQQDSQEGEIDASVQQQQISLKDKESV